MAKTLGFGVTLTTTTSTGTVTIGNIRNVSHGDASGETVDSTTHDSTDGNYRTFIGSLVDPGELTLELLSDPAASPHKLLNQRLGTRTAHAYTVTLPTTTSDTEVFSAIISSVGEEIPLDDVITSSVGFKKTGTPGFST